MPDTILIVAYDNYNFLSHSLSFCVMCLRNMKYTTCIQLSYLEKVVITCSDCL